MREREGRAGGDVIGGGGGKSQLESAETISQMWRPVQELSKSALLFEYVCFIFFLLFCIFSFFLSQFDTMHDRVEDNGN